MTACCTTITAHFRWVTDGCQLGRRMLMKRITLMSHDTIELGTAGLELEVGDHLCVFYRGQEERDAVLLPFLETGLQHGEKIICTVDHEADGPALGAFRADPSVQQSMENGQLTLVTDQDSYLADGDFSHAATISLWDQAMAEALDGGFDFIRGVGEMTWASTDVEQWGESVLRYEQRIAELGKYPQVIMCLYDLNHFTNGQFLLEVLRTHPKVLMGELLINNPWYVLSLIHI